MDDVFIYYVNFPDDVKEMVMPCFDGFTLYINERLPREAKIRAYNHAMRHIASGDFEKHNVNDIEISAHRKGVTNDRNT